MTEFRRKERRQEFTTRRKNKKGRTDFLLTKWTSRQKFNLCDRILTERPTSNSELEGRTRAGIMELAAAFLLSVLLASLLQPLRGDTNADDLEGLRLFYSRLNSPPLLTGWNDSEGDPCSDLWTGITCDIDGKNVTQIELPGFLLNGTLSWSSGLDRLQNLKVLDLSDNQLQGAIPDNLPRSIAVLNLESNNLSRGIPWSLGLLVSLTELRLAHNNMTGNITNTFAELSSLVILDLSDNGFTGRIPKSLRNLSQLSFLYLEGNEIDSGLHVLTHLKSLQTLDIRNNAFHGGEIPPQLLAIPNFEFSVDEFPDNAAPPFNQFNSSLSNSPSPAPSPLLGLGDYNSVPPVFFPHRTNVTAARNREQSSFWYPERIAGLTVVSFLAMVASALIFMLFKWRHRDKKCQNENSAVWWLGPRRSSSCPRLIKW